MIEFALQTWHVIFLASIGAVCFAIVCDMIGNMFRYSTEVMLKSKSNTTIIVSGNATQQQLKALQDKYDVPYLLNSSEITSSPSADDNVIWQEEKFLNNEVDFVEKDKTETVSVDLSDTELALYNDLKEEKQHEEPMSQQRYSSDRPVQQPSDNISAMPTPEEYQENAEEDIHENNISVDEPIDDTPPAKETWEDYGIKQEQYEAFPTMEIFEEKQEGKGSVFGIIFGHHEHEGRYAIRFGSPQCQKWIEVNEKVYQAGRESVLLIAVLFSPGKIDQDTGEGVMIAQADGQLVNYVSKDELSA